MLKSVPTAETLEKADAPPKSVLHISVPAGKVGKTRKVLSK
jgi:hypothetical protein